MAGLSKLKIGLFLALLFFFSVAAHAAQEKLMPPLTDRGSELQKAAGKDWSVTALPDGYLLTYLPPITFYPATWENSKIDSYEQAAHGKKEHLLVRIIIHSFSQEEKQEFNDDHDAREAALKKAPGFFLCSIPCSTIGYWQMPQRMVNLNFDIWFFSNFAPDKLAYPENTVDIYTATMQAVAPLLGLVQFEGED